MRILSKKNFNGEDRTYVYKKYYLLIRWMTINISGKTPQLSSIVDLSEHDVSVWL